MSRLARTAVATREAYMRGLFELDPKLSAAAANVLFHAKFGSKMRSRRVYDLRTQVRNAAPSFGSIDSNYVIRPAVIPTEDAVNTQPTIVIQGPSAVTPTTTLEQAYRLTQTSADAAIKGAV